MARRDHVVRAVDSLVHALRRHWGQVLGLKETASHSRTVVEALEVRQLLSGHVLTGGAGNDTFFVRLSPSDAALTQVLDGSPTGTVLLEAPRAEIDSLTIDGGGGDDLLIVDYSVQHPLRTGVLHFNGAAGTDTVKLVGRTGLAGSYRPDAAQTGAGMVTAGQQDSTFTGVEAVRAAAFDAFSLVTPNSADAIEIASPEAAWSRLSGSSGGVGFAPLNVQSVKKLIVDVGENDAAGAGNDSIVVAASGIAATGLEVLKPVSGTGVDTMDVQGGTVPLDGGEGAASLRVNVYGSAQVQLLATQRLDWIHVNSADATAGLPAGLYKVVTVRNLDSTIGHFDLANNDLIVQHNDGTDGESVRFALEAMVRSARQGGWTGIGLGSSAAAGSVFAGVGIINNNFEGEERLSQFGGQTVGTGSVLVKYTYYGDVNFDGEVTGSDYSVIDTSFWLGVLNGGWASGDVNYDGVVDSSDYALVDLVNWCGMPQRPTFSVPDPATVNEWQLYPLALTNPNGADPITRWTVYWGDGSVQWYAGSADGVNAGHYYAEDSGNSIYVITVMAQVGELHYHAYSTAVEVLNVAPALGLSGETTVVEGALYRLGVSCADGGDAVSLRVNWGDGSAEEIYAGDAELMGHVFETIPASGVTVTAVDDEGGTRVETWEVGVVPAGPEDLTAVTTAQGVVLAWSDLSAIESAYEIERAAGPGEAFEWHRTMGAGATTATVCLSGEGALYRVRAVNACGGSTYSNEAVGVADPAAIVPATVTGASATTDALGITLQWSAASGAERYNVYRGIGAAPDTTGTPYKSGVLGTSYRDEEIVNGETYWYVVAGVNGAGVGVGSSEMVRETYPAAPKGLGAIASFDATNGDQIQVWWESVGGATGYRLYIDGQAALGTLTSTQYVDTSVQSGEQHKYRVSAVNALGEGPCSTTLTVKSRFAPGDPDNLTAVSAGALVTLSWTLEADASYQILRKLGEETFQTAGTCPVAPSAAEALFSETLTVSGTYTYRVEALRGSSVVAGAAEATITVDVNSSVPEAGLFDLDVDSDNDAGLYLVQSPLVEHAANGNAAEEGLEGAEPGRFVVVFNGDRDRDGVLDFMDGHNRDGILGNADDDGGMSLTPLNVRVNTVGTTEQLARQRARLVYNDLEPSASEVPAGSGGMLRVWSGVEGGRRTGFVESGAAFSGSTLSGTYWIEAVREGAAEIALEFSADEGETWSRDAVYVTGVTPEVDVDSDNSGVIDQADEAAEHGVGVAGRLVGVNEGDADGDGIVGWADGFDLDGVSGNADDLSMGEEAFAEVRITLAEPIDPSKAKIRIRYHEGLPQVEGKVAPAGVVRRGGATAEQGIGHELEGIGGGGIRLWTKGSGTRRSKESFLEDDGSGKGYYVSSGSEAAGAGELSKLGLTGSSRTFSLWAEGLWESGSLAEQWIVVEVDPDGAGPLEFGTAGGWRDEVRLTVVGVDVDLGTSTGNTTAEDALEDRSGSAGRLLAVNDNDGDGDGIVDWADGFNWSGTDDPADDQAAGEQFEAVRVTVGGAVDLEAARIRFSYDASDPDTVTMTEAGMYTLGAGSMRLWKKGGAESRSRFGASNGGDYVASGAGYTAAELGFAAGSRSVTLWLEAVRASEGMGDKRVVVELDPDGAGPAGYAAWDAARGTAVGWGLRRVTAEGTLTAADAMELSTVSPVFSGVSFEVSDPHVNAEGTGMVGDIRVRGNLEDASLDLEGSYKGVIDWVELEVGGVTSASLRAPVVVTKTRGNSLLKPYDFGGKIDTVFRDVPLAAGWNAFRLRAENGYGLSGYADGSAEIVLEAPADQMRALELSFPSELSENSGDAIEARMQIDSGAWTQYTLSETGPQTLRFVSGDGSVAVQLSGPVIFDPNVADAMTVTVENAPFVAVFGALMDLVEKPTDQDPEGKNTRVFAGEQWIEEHDRVDLTGYTARLGGVGAVSMSAGGEMHPFVLELKGPRELATSMEVSFNELVYKPIWQDDGMFLAQRDSQLPEVLIALPKATKAAEPEGEARNGFWSEAAGFGMGLADTGIGVWEGVKGTFSALWEVKRLVGDYHFITVAYRLTQTGSVLTLEDSESIKAKAGLAQKLWEIAGKVATDYQGFNEAVMIGDVEEINRLGEEYQVAFEFSVELLRTVAVEIAGMSDYDRGRIKGRIIGEVLLAVATAGAGNALKGATMTGVIGKLKTVGFIARHPGLVSKLDEALTLMTKLSETRMCFAAGTAVWTSEGPKPIERIERGELVLSREAQTGRQGWKPVVRTFVTEPRSLYRLEYAREDGWGIGELVTTAPHPFWVINAQAFVSAEELRLGDEFLLADGGRAELVEIEIEEAAEGTRTYNFEVADYHTYFVGEEGVWVHNAGGRECERIASLFGRIIKKDFPDNPVEAYLKVRSKLPQMSEAAQRGVVDDVLKELVEMKGNNTLNARLIQLGEDTANTLWREREVFAAVRFEKKRGVTLQRVARGEKGDFKEVGSGRVWEVKGTVPSTGSVEGLIQRIKEHISQENAFNLIADVGGLNTQTKNRIRSLLESRFSGRYVLLED